jgi:hypothetical protein
MPVTPMKMHILFIPSLIRTIFFALDKPSEVLENLFEMQRQKNDIQRS